jgi:NADPH-dependent glutamate synthase beta subunit-like oxidoreductase
LEAINYGKKVDLGKQVAVVGGGNVAIDVARSALRLGADKVTMLYRRTLKEMPASKEEIEYALEEGVNIEFLVAPTKILAEKDELKVESIRMELGEPDASGRRSPVPVKGSEFILKAERLIMAIGQRSVVPKGFSVLTDKSGRLVADKELLSCSLKGVFAGGDVVSGPATVIKAIEAGRKAASSIDKYLGGSGEIYEELVAREEEPPCLGKEEQFAYKKRDKIPVLPLEKRLKGFPEVEDCLSKYAAMDEAKRCLRCQLRLKISSVPLPPLPASSSKK